MRISDWSSDVCSSDLLHKILPDLAARPDVDKIFARNDDSAALPLARSNATHLKSGSRLTRSRALIRSRRIKGISARRYGLWLRPSVFPPDCATPPCTCMAPRHRGCCCMDLAASVYPIFAPRCAGRHGGPIAATTQCYHHLIGGSPARAARRFAYRALAADGLGLAAVRRAWRKLNGQAHAHRRAPPGGDPGRRRQREPYRGT